MKKTAAPVRPGADPAAVISHEWWQKIFAGDTSVLGRTIYLNYRPFTVVGVASPEFQGSVSGFRPNVWIPFTPFKDRYTRWAARSEDRDIPLVWVYARLRAAASPEQGPAERRGSTRPSLCGTSDRLFPTSPDLAILE